METPIVHRMNFFLTGFTESRAAGTVIWSHDLPSIVLYVVVVWGWQFVNSDYPGSLAWDVDNISLVRRVFLI